MNTNPHRTNLSVSSQLGAASGHPSAGGSPQARRRPGHAALLLGLALAIGAGPAGAVTITARKADNFMEFLGVRMELMDTAYTGHWTECLSNLQTLKFRHVRTRCQGYTSNSGWIGRVNDLLGLNPAVTCNFVFPNPSQGSGARHTDIDNAISSFGKANILAFEAANEWNNDEPDGTWENTVKTQAADIYNYLIGSKDWGTKPVICPSIYDRITADYTRLANQDIEDVCTKGNIHYYPAIANLPSTCRTKATKTSSTVVRPLDDCIGTTYGAQIMTPSYTVWVTECGYQTNGRTGHPEDPDRVAKWLPRMVGELYKRAATTVSKMFIFELMDTSAGSFGLTDGSGNPKQVFTSLANMTAILDDSATSFTPQDLTVTFTNLPGDAHYFLLQKGDGHRYLVMWREIDYTGSDQTQSVTITFPTGVNYHVKTYKPYVSTVATNKGVVNSFSINLPDHLLIAEIY